MKKQILSLLVKEINQRRKSMKRRLRNRVLAVLLSLMLLIGLMPAMSMTAFAADTGTGKAIQIGMSQIKGGQASGVYFGNYYQSDANGNTKEPVKWQVLSNTDGKLFLLSD